MDFLYEQTVSKEPQETSETSQPKDVKTEEQFHKLEDKVAETYTQLESKASVWGSSLGTFFKGINREELLRDVQEKTKSLTQKTSHYLDDLDKELEVVETFAQSYASKLITGIKTFNVQDNTDNDEDVEIDEKESNLLFNVSSNRKEAQLNKLATNKDIYLKFKPSEAFTDFSKSFKIDEAKTIEISNLVKDKKLAALQTEVSEHVPFEEFWKIYFFERSQIELNELKRQNLIIQDEVPTSWDDDDDEDDDDEEGGDGVNKSSAITSDGTIEAKSINSSTVQVDKKKTTPTKKTKPAKEPKDEAKEGGEEEESDDDWE